MSVEAHGVGLRGVWSCEWVGELGISGRDTLPRKIHSH